MAKIIEIIKSGNPKFFSDCDKTDKRVYYNGKSSHCVYINQADIFDDDNKINNVAGVLANIGITTKIHNVRKCAICGDFMGEISDAEWQKSLKICHVCAADMRDNRESERDDECI